MGIRSWHRILMVLRSMRNDLKVADELYIPRGCLALEDTPFFLFSVVDLNSNERYDYETSSTLVWS